MSEKYKKTCKYLNYVENVLILSSTITSCVLLSAFASLVDIRNKHFCNKCSNQKLSENYKEKEEKTW